MIRHSRDTENIDTDHEYVLLPENNENLKVETVTTYKSVTAILNLNWFKKGA